MEQITLPTCPYCGHNVEAQTALGKQKKEPTPGDATLCVYCAGLSIFEAGLTLRKFTASDAAIFERRMPGFMDYIEGMQAEVKAYAMQRANMVCPSCREPLPGFSELPPAIVAMLVKGGEGSVSVCINCAAPIKFIDAESPKTALITDAELYGYAVTHPDLYSKVRNTQARVYSEKKNRN